MSGTTKIGVRAHAGDAVVVAGHRVGEAERVGEILEVLGDEGHEHYRVRWNDGRETVFYPSNDAVIRPSKRARRGRKSASQQTA